MKKFIKILLFNTITLYSFAGSSANADNATTKSIPLSDQAHKVDDKHDNDSQKSQSNGPKPLMQDANDSMPMTFEQRKTLVIQKFEQLKTNYMQAKTLIEENFGKFFIRFTNGALGMHEILKFFNNSYKITNEQQSTIVESFLKEAAKNLSIKPLEETDIPYKVLKSLIVKESISLEEIAIQNNPLIYVMYEIIHRSQLDGKSPYIKTLDSFDEAINYVKTLNEPIVADENHKNNKKSFEEICSKLCLKERLLNITAYTIGMDAKQLLYDDFDGLLSFLKLCAFCLKGHNLLNGQLDGSNESIPQIVKDLLANTNINVIPVPPIDLTPKDTTIDINSILTQIEEILSHPPTSTIVSSRLLDICLDTEIMSMITLNRAATSTKQQVQPTSKDITSRKIKEIFGTKKAPKDVASTPQVSDKPEKIKEIFVKNSLMETTDNDIMIGLYKLAQIIKLNKSTLQMSGQFQMRDKIVAFTKNRN